MQVRLRLQNNQRGVTECFVDDCTHTVLLAASLLPIVGVHCPLSLGRCESKFSSIFFRLSMRASNLDPIEALMSDLNRKKLNSNNISFQSGSTSG